MPGDQLTPVMIFRFGVVTSGGETVAVDAERELDHPRNAVRFAVASIVGERLGIAAGGFHEAVEMLLADHAKLGGPHRLAVLLKRGQKPCDVVAVGLVASEKIMQRDVRGADLVQAPPSALRSTRGRETR